MRSKFLQDSRQSGPYSPASDLLESLNSEKVIKNCDESDAKGLRSVAWGRSSLIYLVYIKCLWKNPSQMQWYQWYWSIIYEFNIFQYRFRYSYTCCNVVSLFFNWALWTKNFTKGGKIWSFFLCSTNIYLLWKSKKSSKHYIWTGFWTSGTVVHTLKTFIVKIDIIYIPSWSFIFAK